MTVPHHTEVVAGCTLTVVKAATASGDAGNAAFGAVGIAVGWLTHGFLDWGPDLSEPRWLVQVSRGADPPEVRTVRTTFTRRAAMRAARRTRSALQDGDVTTFASLPDYAV